MYNFTVASLRQEHRRSLGAAITCDSLKSSVIGLIEQCI